MRKETRNEPCEGLVSKADILPSYIASIKMHFDPYENLTNNLHQKSTEPSDDDMSSVEQDASLTEMMERHFGGIPGEPIFSDPDEWDGKGPYNVVELDSVGNPDLVFEWTDRIAAYLAASRGTEGHLLQYKESDDLCYLNPATNGDGQSTEGLMFSAIARAQAMIAMEEASYTLTETLTQQILPGLTDIAGLGNPWTYKDKGDFIKIGIPWLDNDWHLELSTSGYEKAGDGSGYSVPTVKVYQNDKCIFDGPADGDFMREQILEKLYQSDFADRATIEAEIAQMKAIGPDEEGYFIEESEFIATYIPYYDGPSVEQDVSAPHP